MLELRESSTTEDLVELRADSLCLLCSFYCIGGGSISVGGGEFYPSRPTSALGCGSFRKTWCIRRIECEKDMISIAPGDLISVERENRYYYAFILDKIQLFGGNLVYVFHRTSDTPLACDEVVDDTLSGFYAFVDLIYAKRQKRVRRLGGRPDLGKRLPRIIGFKRTMTLKGKAKLWILSDLNLKETERVECLTEEQKRLPLEVVYTDLHMARLAAARWSPEQDERI
jgi:hypothetical protein